MGISMNKRTLLAAYAIRYTHRHMPSTYIYTKSLFFNLKKHPDIIYGKNGCKIKVSTVPKTMYFVPCCHIIFKCTYKTATCHHWWRTIILFQGFVYFLQMTQLYRVYLECIPSWKQLHSFTAQYLFTIDRKYSFLIIK